MDYLQFSQEASILKAGRGEGPCRLYCCASWGNESGCDVGMWPVVPGSHPATLGSLLQGYPLLDAGSGGSWEPSWHPYGPWLLPRPDGPSPMWLLYVSSLSQPLG